MYLALLNTKGGVGKSTSAAYLASGLARTGPTLLVDADPQQTVRRWASLAGEGFPPTEALAPRHLDQRLPTLAADYRHVVVDGPPGDTAISRKVASAVEVVVVPISPSLMDINRLRPTLDLLAEVEDEHPVVLRVLLTKLRARTVSGREARDWLEERGQPLLRQSITLRESYATSFGLVLPDLGEYQAVLDELLAVRVGVGR